MLELMRSDIVDYPVETAKSVIDYLDSMQIRLLPGTFYDSLQNTVCAVSALSIVALFNTMDDENLYYETRSAAFRYLVDTYNDMRFKDVQKVLGDDFQRNEWDDIEAGFERYETETETPFVRFGRLLREYGCDDDDDDQWECE